MKRRRKKRRRKEKDEIWKEELGGREGGGEWEAEKEKNEGEGRKIRRMGGRGGMSGLAEGECRKKESEKIMLEK